MCVRVTLLDIKDTAFPPVEKAKDSGLLAVGGDLSVDRILRAYMEGIFPWYSEGGPVLWWCPDPRCVLIPSELKISRSLQKELNKKTFTITYNQEFSKVIHHCGEVPRPGQNGTWLQPEMIEAYIELHKLGFAQSIEAWSDGELVGGLYGVVIEQIFFGESMFYLKPNASKVAFITLVQQLKEKNFKLIDCQQTTPHMLRMGAKEISRKEFMKALNENLLNFKSNNIS